MTEGVVFHVGEIDATTMTVKELMLFMVQTNAGQLTMPCGGNVFLHVVMMHDQDESNRLRSVLIDAVERSIIKANERYEESKKQH